MGRAAPLFALITAAVLSCTAPAAFAGAAVSRISEQYVSDCTAVVLSGNARLQTMKQRGFTQRPFAWVKKVDIAYFQTKPKDNAYCIVTFARVFVRRDPLWAAITADLGRHGFRLVSQTNFSGFSSKKREAVFTNGKQMISMQAMGDRSAPPLIRMSRSAS